MSAQQNETVSVTVFKELLDRHDKLTERVAKLEQRMDLVQQTIGLKRVR